MKEIYIEQEDNIKKIYLIENNIIIEKHNEDIENPMIEGNIYVGKVQNVLPGMQAAFVRIGKNKNAFIHLKDILPKEDVTKKQENDEKKCIQNIIRPGDLILVQVTRDENSKKGARVSCHISFTGRFFMYMPRTPFIAVSQKITDQNRKKELKEFFRENLPKGDGGVVRTSAINASKEQLTEEIEKLISKWEEVKNTKYETIPEMVYNSGGIIRKYLIDNADKGLEKVYVQNSKLQDEITKLLKEENIDIPVLIDKDLLTKFDYEQQLKKAENRKIWLDCGGFITIDKTEALTAIDVNSGKFIGKDNFENTVFEVNREATIEIAKQLRLRDIGGIIIIDYIDMHIDKNKEEILKLIEEEIKKDNSKVQIDGFTKLNLLELTRKHVYTI